MGTTWFFKSHKVFIFVVTIFKFLAMCLKRLKFIMYTKIEVKKWHDAILIECMFLAPLWSCALSLVTFPVEWLGFLSWWFPSIPLKNVVYQHKPQRKKSGFFRSGDRGGQGISPKREITLPGKAFLETFHWNFSGMGWSPILLEPNVPPCYVTTVKWRQKKVI